MQIKSGGSFREPQINLACLINRPKAMTSHACSESSKTVRVLSPDCLIEFNLLLDYPKSTSIIASKVTMT